jgi:hypothetical protein
VPASTEAGLKKSGDCLELVRRRANRASELPRVPDILSLEASAMKTHALELYWQVADLVQKGQTDQARNLAVTIPIDHLRGLALLLANYSRRL